jgi:hypothetical protein
MDRHTNRHIPPWRTRYSSRIDVSIATAMGIATVGNKNVYPMAVESRMNFRSTLESLGMGLPRNLHEGPHPSDTSKTSNLSGGILIKSTKVMNASLFGKIALEGKLPHSAIQLSKIAPNTKSIPQFIR